MQSWKTLKVTQVEPFIMQLAMSRPERRNAVNVEMAHELVACIGELREQKDLRVLIVTGDGSAFGSGADLKERAVLSAEATQAQRDVVLQFIGLLENFHAPVLAMINGPAIAGALEIALACDIRIASEQAVFALPEVSKRAQA